MLQLHLSSRLNTWLHWIRQRHLQDDTRNIQVWGFGVSYIRDFTVNIFIAKLSMMPMFNSLRRSEWATHICVSKLPIIGSDNGLSHGWCQAIMWNNAGLLLIEPLGTNFGEIINEIYTFPFKKMHFKMASGKWQRPFCFGLNVLITMRQPSSEVQFWCGTGGRFKNAYQLLNLRALKSSPLNKIHIFQCMGEIFCVEFQRYPLKIHTKYLTHTLKNTTFIQHWNFKSS